jgi:hypothetical protein
MTWGKSKNRVAGKVKPTDAAVNEKMGNFMRIYGLVKVRGRKVGIPNWPSP